MRRPCGKSIAATLRSYVMHAAVSLAARSMMRPFSPGGIDRSQPVWRYAAHQLVQMETTQGRLT